MENTFGRWFGLLVDQTGLKKKAIAAEAEIDPVSLSRILNGAQGISRDTATRLARALNTLSGREIANEETAVRLAVGLEIDQPRKAKTAKEALEIMEKLVPGFEGILTAEGITDENAQRILDDFLTVIELHKRRNG